ncbi:hypothetical protein MNBD_GAMMA11-2012 [hydrothermal vent metagenome]|uniref:Uncharacterized protein n=1 Tax=hydrothermal vent metagenome TaxID=652676 RepID=A0A3B0WPF9_9ZZZZ
MEMNTLWDTLSSYPTSIYTVLIGVLIVFWLFAIIGALDIDIISFDADVDIDVDLDIDADVEIPGFVGLLHTLGFTGVPFTIVLTVLIFLAWIFTYYISTYVIPLVPGTILKIIAGTATLAGSLVLAVPITTKIISPLRKLSLENNAKSSKDFLGAMCTVISSKVDETQGDGEIKAAGAGIVAHIRAESPNDIKKGDIVRPISYDAEKGIYHVISDKEFEKNLES